MPLEETRTVPAKSDSISLTILVPAYNERYLIGESLGRLKILEAESHLSGIEVIVIDDGSTDGTALLLENFKNNLASGSGRNISWSFLRHEANRGKGAAIETGLAQATGDYTIVHDADLEYDPADIGRLARIALANDADAVFGSRFVGSEVRRVLMYRHQVGNKLLTFACNLASNLNLTDIWTGYKLIRTWLLKSIPLESTGFEIEAELTIKLAKRDARIFETPIRYYGRNYEEGKKITWRDGLRGLWAIARFTLSDRVFREDEYGSQILGRLGRARRFNLWMADTIRPYCGEQVLEIGSGVGNLSRTLVPRSTYVASDINPLYLQTLRNLEFNRPYLKASYCDINEARSFTVPEAGYDTVICLNVIEHVEDDRAALNNIRAVLSEHGWALILVPQGPWNFGSLDEVLGHRRRYTHSSLTQLAEQCGMRIEKLIGFNRIGSIAWFLNGRLMRRRTFGLIQIWLLDLLTPLFRRIDRFLPLPPLSLIAVMCREAE